MTTALAIEVAEPRDIAYRGGDVRGYDVTQAREVYGPHVFAATTDIIVTNGLLRFKVGATGIVPTLTLSAYRAGVTTGDYYVDIYTDIYSGSVAASAWQALGTVVCDKTSGTTLLTSARLLRVTPEEATVELVTDNLSDIFVTLRRGERMLRIQHGSSRYPVTAARRVRWATPVLVGTATPGRVEELVPAVEGFPRFLAALGLATSASFNVSATGQSVLFAAGVGTQVDYERPHDMHAQLATALRAGVHIGEGLPLVEVEGYGSYEGGY